MITMFRYSTISGILILHLYIVFVVFVLSDKTTLAAKNQTKRLCPSSCFHVNRCRKWVCRYCQYSCVGKCEYNNNFWGKKCLKSCDASKCSTFSCQGCLYCKGGGVNPPPTSAPKSSCLFAKFEDYTQTTYSKAVDFNQWRHSGMPYKYYGPPVFVDLNGDNVLDYFNPMHYHPVIPDGYDNIMELALGTTSSDSMTFKLQPLLNKVIFTDEQVMNLDTHSVNIVDLDGDGILDIYVTSGGGRGLLVAGKEIGFHDRDNLLFWGEKQPDPSGKLNLVFVGGRQTAVEAGVHMRYGRGRLSYIFDANGDGLLDIFVYQDRTVTNLLVPGVLLINLGNRKWKADTTMSEYTRAMLLTDADGDGIAQEILLSRGFCYPQRDGPSVDPNYPEFGSFNLATKQFCASRPVGTIAVYRYGPSTKVMSNVANNYRSYEEFEYIQPPCCPHGSNTAESDCHAIGIASGDFDGDLKADHIMLYRSKMDFYFSTDRVPGQVPADKEDIGKTIYFPSYCEMAIGFHIVDLDNDGQEEILVSCYSTATFLLYTKQSTQKGAWSLQNGCNSFGALGDLLNPHLTSFSYDEMSSLCNEDESNYDKMKKKVCNDFRNDQLSPQLSGLCLVDLNNDGYLDATTTYDFGYLKTFMNTPKINHRFIAFRLLGDGKKINRYGIGATVILFCRHKNTNELSTQFREFSSKQHTSGITGCKDDRIIFGLGQNLLPMRVEVRWPDGKETLIWLTDWWKFQKKLNPFLIHYKGKYATAPPTESPTLSPTTRSTLYYLPSSTPSMIPSRTPSGKPSHEPSVTLTSTPSHLPSVIPSMIPSRTPSGKPSHEPATS